MADDPRGIDRPGLRAGGLVALAEDYACWITTQFGGPVSPQQVIRSRSMDEAIRAALSDAAVDEPEVVSFLDLPEPFLRHEIVHRLFPDLNDALDKLGGILAGILAIA